jgi:pyruvate ferredoxin oxidoreductase gamma subunit
MVEDIRIHGMGGQGVVASSEIIAHAASFEGKFCRAFPMYGSARRGAPVLAFAQIGSEAEATRSMIYNPKYLLVLDPSMLELEGTTEGLREDGTVIVNSPSSIKDVKRSLPRGIKKIGVIDATGIASRIIGRPIPNCPMLGAFVKITGLLRLQSILKAIDKRFPGNIAEVNKEAARVGFEQVEQGDGSD